MSVVVREVNMSRMESPNKSPSEDDQSHHDDHAKRGGWRAVRYILVNESLEKLASMSLITNLMLYLKLKYNMEGVWPVHVMNLWSGCCNILTIGGAILSDAYLGRFYTILVGSIAALLGMCGMTFASAVDKMRPPQCSDQQSDCIGPSSWQLGFLYSSLGLLAIGAGCIRPCNIAFGADQFDERTEEGRAQLQPFYNWWYFSFTLALLVAFTAVVYIQTDVSWFLGLAIPTACFVVSIAALLAGCRLFAYKKPEGSIFIDMAKVAVASYRKRKLSLISGQAVLYDPSFSTRTSRMRFFEKAALISHPGELTTKGWSLCSVQQVERFKCVVGILPVWVSSILSFLTMNQQNMYGILQAVQMDRKVGSRFTIPPGWISLVSMSVLALCILTYEYCAIPLMKKLKKVGDPRLSLKLRIMTGIAISIPAMIVSALVEKARREAALKEGSLVSPLTIWHLVPPLALSGLVEAFASVSILEFFTTQMPKNMSSTGGAIFFLSLSMGSYLSSALVSVVNKVTKNDHGRTWLGDQDLNHNRLDYYFYLIAGIAAVNLVYFAFFASNYIFTGDSSSSSAGTTDTTEQTDQELSSSTVV